MTAQHNLARLALAESACAVAEPVLSRARKNGQKPETHKPNKYAKRPNRTKENLKPETHLWHRQDGGQQV
jgi:hypothetical protein